MHQYPAKTIAAYFLFLSKSSGNPITPMKLQKLIYFAHGWCLAITGKPLIMESVQAWPYGPVIRSIYDQYKKYGANAIPFDDDCDLNSIKEDASATSILDKVWHVYGRLGAYQLSNMTHELGTPWQQARGNCQDKIDNAAIQRYFTEKAARSAAS